LNSPPNAGATKIGDHGTRKEGTTLDVDLLPQVS